MFHSVVLKPSGRAFEVRQGESILHAGLRAGANLRYSCSNGTCGECRAQLLAGKVEQIQHHDFCFPAAEAAQGLILMCCNTACEDVQLSAVELGGVADIPEQSVSARITKVEHPSEHYAIAYLRTPRSQSLQFLAGQEVHVSFANGPDCRLPLANCPCDGLHPQFHVRYRADEELATAMFAALRKGATCELRGPVGEFVLHEQPERALLFIAYETGFAPVYSLLEHVIALEWQAPIRLLWLVDSASGAYMHNYCRALHDGLDDFTFMIDEVGDATRFDERLRALLRRESALGDYDIYVAPPPRAAASTRATLLEHGVTEDCFRIAELESI